MRLITIALAGLAIISSVMATDVAQNGSSPGMMVPPPECSFLNETNICKRFDNFAIAADHLYDQSKRLDCDERSKNLWQNVAQGVYLLGVNLNLFDFAIDASDLNRCYERWQEARIACCYERYADSLIRLVNIISEKLMYLDGETAKFLVTALNSLRNTDYAVIHELGRRLQYEKPLIAIFTKHGSMDGSTPGSVFEAFSRIVYTPLINGETVGLLVGESEYEHCKGHHGSHHDNKPPCGDSPKKPCHEHHEKPCKEEKKPCWLEDKPCKDDKKPPFADFVEGDEVEVELLDKPINKDGKKGFF